MIAATPTTENPMRTELPLPDDFRTNDDAQWELIRRLTKDMLAAAKLISRREATWLVRFYYSIQKFRIQSNHKTLKHTESGEPHSLISWISTSLKGIEEDIRKSLNSFAREYTVGLWQQSLIGIGPCISAGMMAHLDITKAKFAGNFHSFAGLNPRMVWEPGTKRPYNADLKALQYKCGESFVKFQNHKDDFYGKYYAERKLRDWQRNLRGELAAAAAAELNKKNYGKDTNAYLWLTGQFPPNLFDTYRHLDAAQQQSFLAKHCAPGKGPPMLPPSQIHARARRHAVKIFLSHLHHVMHVDYYGIEPPRPYILDKPDPVTGTLHTHFIPPPNWPMAEAGKSLREWS